jgi:23S rRNA (uracil1939-C5)-methyltransferase
MSVKKGQTIDLDITAIAFGGKGLARLDGMAVFVDQVVPSDRARVRIVRKRKNYAEARLLALLDPSPHRVDPPCPYSGTCGGCTWQFLAYEKQLEYKQQHVVDALEHIGGLQGTPVRDILPSPLRFGYRNKMEFTCSDRRWLLPREMGQAGIDADFALGLHVPGTFYKVLDTRACLLQPDLGNEILSEVRTYMKKSARPPYGLRSHTGFWRFLMLRHSAAYDQWMVNLITAEEIMTEVRPLASHLMQRYPHITSVVNNITARKAGIAQGETEVRLAGASVITEKIGDLEFEISANSFFQTNTAGAAQLYRTVTEFAELTGSERVVDLYSGTGSIALWLAPSAARVTGIEIVESAVADAEKNCRRNRIDNCRFLRGDIQEVLPNIQVPPEVLIIDPPRAGMHKNVVRQVLEMGPSRIVYVSCNPATLARDLAVMSPVYRVADVQPVDMFPHTFHIEVVVRLDKKPGAGRRSSR